MYVYVNSCGASKIYKFNPSRSSITNKRLQSFHKHLHALTNMYQQKLRCGSLNNEYWIPWFMPMYDSRTIVRNHEHDTFQDNWGAWLKCIFLWIGAPFHEHLSMFVDFYFAFIFFPLKKLIVWMFTVCSSVDGWLLALNEIQYTHASIHLGTNAFSMQTHCTWTMNIPFTELFSWTIVTTMRPEWANRNPTKIPSFHENHANEIAIKGCDNGY